MALLLITNRSQDDVDRALFLNKKIRTTGWDSLTDDERSEYMGSGDVLYGEYRHTDMNRVGVAVATLAGLLNSYGYPVSVSPKTDWTANDKPSPVQRATYIADVAAIKARLYGSTTIPATMDGLTHTQANNIEELLLEIEQLINSMVGTFLYSGCFYSGADHQEQLLQGVI